MTAQNRNLLAARLTDDTPVAWASTASPGYICPCIRPSAASTKWWIWWSRLHLSGGSAGAEVTIPSEVHVVAISRGEQTFSPGQCSSRRHSPFKSSGYLGRSSQALYWRRRNIMTMNVIVVGGVGGEDRLASLLLARRVS
jgi:hypothetical protein